MFETDVSSTDAEETLVKTDAEMADATAEKLVYYPYRVFEFDLHAEALLDEFDDRVYCGVDLCNNKEMFIDESPDPTETVIAEDAVVPTADESIDPERTARRHLVNLARKELRIGSAPDLTVVDDIRIYRPFHVVTCTTTAEQQLTYIVDAVTGEFHRIYLN
ncbi:hypothetical protein C488_14652 [Natrinema pellirubrum DSM 15624]|uniref:Uncharacterized protein n=1 Tax=Natrinema pellirubrum (strain DSM 15624 / CIP 106293 / JCM 10476 / NCIMB 786 / 157) TaxID=797303 RepID=L9YHB8_NATP1|nr:hypothetical protein C488_14652 [Natrinema pellirubrum DSM 15624]